MFYSFDELSRNSFSPDMESNKFRVLPARLEQMSPEDIIELEKRLRKEYSREDFGHGSSLGFLGANESFRAVVERDAQILQELGLTYDEIAKILQADETQKLLTIGGRLRQQRGFPQYCPWGDAEDTNYAEELEYRDQKTGLSIKYCPLHTHLISVHHFFEGDTLYRFDPRLFARVIGKLH